MVKGVGVDLCSISRIRNILDREGPEGAFFRRAFSDAEQEEASLRHDLASFYAARFAVKEAVYKAVAPLTKNGFDLRIVESVHRPDGSPVVRITDALQPYLEESGIGTLHLSITTEGDYAAAFVVAE
ncbi:MAG: holo-ACP synthase [Oscillospiraceae bacterium]|nr:holo-ACP synthase [Oscillospiraceae bacterium]